MNNKYSTSSTLGAPSHDASQDTRAITFPATRIKLTQPKALGGDSTAHKPVLKLVHSADFMSRMFFLQAKGFQEKFLCVDCYSLCDYLTTCTENTVLFTEVAEMCGTFAVKSLNLRLEKTFFCTLSCIFFGIFLAVHIARLHSGLIVERDCVVEVQ